MKVTDEKEALVVELPGRTFKTLIDQEVIGSKHITFGLAVIPEGSGLPWHSHEGSEEILYVLQGTGSAESRSESRPIQTGKVIYMEANSEHRFVNEGKGEMKLLCSFSPPVKIRAPK